LICICILRWTVETLRYFCVSRKRMKTSAKTRADDRPNDYDNDGRTNTWSLRYFLLTMLAAIVVVVVRLWGPTKRTDKLVSESLLCLYLFTLLFVCVVFVGLYLYLEVRLFCICICRINVAAAKNVVIHIKRGERQGRSEAVDALLSRSHTGCLH